MLLLLFASASLVSAQDTKAPATKTQTKQSAKSTDTKSPPAKAQATKAPATKAPARPGLAVAAETTSRVRPPVIMREVYDYDGGGRRDPFFSLLATAELRPTVADLVIVGILYDPSGRRSVVTLRDIQTKTRYQVTNGTQLGRMRVALIKRHSVVFSIEEFGLNRLDSLVLGDPSKVRGR